MVRGPVGEDAAPGRMWTGRIQKARQNRICRAAGKWRMTCAALGLAMICDAGAAEICRAVSRYASRGVLEVPVWTLGHPVLIRICGFQRTRQRRCRRSLSNVGLLRQTPISCNLAPPIE